MLGDSFGLFGKQSVFSGCFLLADGLAELVPLGLTPLLFFLQSSLLLDVGTSLVVFHFFTKVDGYLKLDNVKTKKRNQSVGDRLMFTNLMVVSLGSFCGFWSVTIPEVSV